MSPPLNTASAVVVSRATTQQPRQITQVASAVLAMVGIAERGPVDQLVNVTSFDGFKARFGDYTANNLETMAAVEGYFTGGGTSLWFVRTVHHTTPGDPSTKTSAAGTLTLDTAATAAGPASVTGSLTAPFQLANGQTLVLAVNGQSNQTATFSATAASRTSGNAGPFALANNDTLTLTVNGGSVITVTFLSTSFVSIGAATPLEVCAVINARFAALQVPAVATVSGSNVVITTDRQGTGAALNITGGTANAGGKLNFTTGSVSGTGNVADIANTTLAEVTSIVQAAVTSPAVTVSGVAGAPKISTVLTGGSASVQVISSSTATGLGFDNAVHAGTSGAAVPTLTLTAEDGSYSGAITAAVLPATSGDTSSFDFHLLLAGLVENTFPNVSMDPTSPRYVLSVVNGNNTLGITIADLLAGPSPTNLPAQGTFGPLTGGGDGLGSLNDSDFAGAISANGKTGLRLIDGDEGAATLLAVPQRATAVVHNAMVTYCNITRNQQLFAILDPPAGMTASQIATYVSQTALLTGSSEVAAFYWPRIQVSTPNATLFGSGNVTVPPSGDIAAAYSRTDATKNLGGAFQQPAGINVGIPRMLGVETIEVLDKAHRDVVTAVLINPISREGNTGFFIDGTLTLLASGNFPSVGQSRGVVTVAKSLTIGLAFARHQNNTPELRKACADLCTHFLNEVTKAGVLASRVPDEAFTVDFGKGLNPPAVQAQRVIQGRIGLATAFPADYIFVDIFPDNSAFEAQLAQAA